MVRIKHRYLLVEILYPATTTKGSSAPLPDTILFHAPSPDYLTPALLARLIKEKIGEIYGDYGVGVVGNSIVVKYLSPATSVSIVRCPRDAYRLVWSALTYLTAITVPATFGARKKDANAADGPEGRSCVCRVVRVSGTIRKAEEEAVRKARSAVLGIVGGGGFGSYGADGVLGRVLGGENEAAGIMDSDDGEDNGEESDEEG